MPNTYTRIVKFEEVALGSLFWKRDREYIKTTERSGRDSLLLAIRLKPESSVLIQGTPPHETNIS